MFLFLNTKNNSKFLLEKTKSKTLTVKMPAHCKFLRNKKIEKLNESENVLSLYEDTFKAV